MAAKKFVLSKDLEEWFDENYPNTTDKALAETLGCCQVTVWRLALRRGLKKSQEHLDLINRRRTQLAAEANKKNAEKIKKFVEASKKYRFKKGVSNEERFGTDINRIRKQRVAEAYNKTLKKEKARVVFGMEQKTRIRIGQQNPERARFKWYLRRRGYIVDDETRTVYWNENTNRGPRVETRDQPWYTFKKQEVV